MFLTFFRFRLLYLQLLSSLGMLVFLWRPLSIYLLKVFLDIREIIAWSWKWANFFGRSFFFITAKEQANFFGQQFSITAEGWGDFFGRLFFITAEERGDSFGRPFFIAAKEQANFFGRPFLSLLKSKVVLLDDHFLSLRCFFFHSFFGCHVWYSWFACDLRLCENPCMLTLV